MRLLPRLGAAVLALAVTAALLRGPVATAAPDDAITRVDAAVAAKLAEMGVPGAIIGLSIPGEIDYVRAVGVGRRAGDGSGAR